MSNLDTETVAPASGGGGADGGNAPAPAERIPLNESPADGPGSGRSALRKQLEKNVESARKEEQRSAPKQRSRARQEMEEQETAPAEGEQEVAEPAENEAPQVKAPEGWAKEAKAAWEQLPPQVQAAVAKREADMAKGVEDLKKKQAEIDQVLQPRMETIRKHGHTPAQAVNQLFAWFEALSANPNVAFPALANSFKFDLRSLPGMQPAPQQQQPVQQQPAAQPGAQPPAGEIPAYVKTLEQQIAELKQGFGQQLNQLSGTFQQQSQQKTEEILMNWAKDKPHFEEVRRVMGKLIESGTVPPLPNGNADLDKAYDMAVYAIPEVRQKLMDEQKAAQDAAVKAKAAAEKKAQQEQADKARRANAGSLGTGAPGNIIAGQTKKSKGKSVRESIMEAQKELSDQ